MGSCSKTAEADVRVGLEIHAKEEEKLHAWGVKSGPYLQHAWIMGILLPQLLYMVSVCV